MAALWERCRHLLDALVFWRALALLALLNLLAQLHVGVKLQ
jgi:hypothetical protein